MRNNPGWSGETRHNRGAQCRPQSSRAAASPPGSATPGARRETEVKLQRSGPASLPPRSPRPGPPPGTRARPAAAFTGRPQLLPPRDGAAQAAPLGAPAAAPARRGPAPRTHRAPRSAGGVHGERRPGLLLPGRHCLRAGSTGLRLASLPPGGAGAAAGPVHCVGPGGGEQRNHWRGRGGWRAARGLPTVAVQHSQETLGPGGLGRCQRAMAAPTAGDRHRGRAGPATPAGSGRRAPGLPRAHLPQYPGVPRTGVKVARRRGRHWFDGDTAPRSRSSPATCRCRHGGAAAAHQPREELLRWRFWRCLPGVRGAPAGHHQGEAAARTGERRGRGGGRCRAVRGSRGGLHIPACTARGAGGSHQLPACTARGGA